MKEVRDLERTIAKRAAIVLAVAVPLLAAGGLHRVAIGGLAGTLFGLASFHLLGAAIGAAVTAGPVRAQTKAGLTYLARYALTALVLYWALRSDVGLFLGTAAGMVMVKFVILLTGILGPL
ncbi:MAG: ATP synthase subunit I [Betaproteobacteria bacterium]